MNAARDREAAAAPEAGRNATRCMVGDEDASRGGWVVAVLRVAILNH